MKITSRRLRAKATQDSTSTMSILQSCMDPVYFINNFYQIQRLATPGSSAITLYPYQEEYVRALLFNKNVVAVMPRQAGVSTVTLGFLLWDAMFHSDQLIVIGACDLANANQLCHIMQLGVRLVPASIRPVVKRLTRNVVEFDNGSKLVISVCSPNFLRGLRPTKIFLDGFAHVTPKVQHDTWALLVQGIAANCNTIMASTPNGPSNVFAKIWEDAHFVQSFFRPFKKTIYDMTQHDAQWQVLMRKAMGESAWRSDFECEFT